jgi:hypothetical protein
MTDTFKETRQAYAYRVPVKESYYVTRAMGLSKHAERRTVLKSISVSEWIEVAHYTSEDPTFTNFAFNKVQSK